MFVLSESNVFPIRIYLKNFFLNVRKLLNIFCDALRSPGLPALWDFGSRSYWTVTTSSAPGASEDNRNRSG